MARAAPAKAGSITWRMLTVETVLLALFLFAMALLHGDILLWAVQSLFAAPLVVVAAIALFTLPGLALLRIFWPHPLDPAERWALAPGLSALGPPLLTLAGSVVNLRWNGVLCWLVLLACGLVGFWPVGNSKNQEPRTKNRESTFAQRFSALGSRFSLLWALGGVTMVALLVRLFVVRDLPGGMFGDSYHHTMIAQLIVDHGGLFRSWEPYAPLETFTYHYGFHSTAAWLTILTGAPVEQTVLQVGQIENALIVPLVFVFTKRLTGNQRASLWAGALAAFASVLPAYYVNWGRYTQLAGQTILPAVCVVWMALLDGNGGRWTVDGGRWRDTETRRHGDKEIGRQEGFRLSSFVVRHNAQLHLGALAALATAGLIVTHYRVAVFAACFVLAYGLYRCVVSPRSLAKCVQLAAVSAVVGISAVVLALPWLLRIREGALLRVANNFVSQNIGSSETNALPGVAELVGFYLGRIMVAFALVGLVALLARRDWRGLTLVLWAGFVLFAANPYLFGLTGAGLLTNFAVLIAAYLLLGPLAGIGVAALFELAGRVSGLQRLVAPATLLGLLAVMLYGLSWQPNILDQSYQILTRGDVEAATWIEQELPANAPIFVNTFPAYGSMVVGSDGGWWLPLLTGHRTNLPPVTYGSEATERGFMTEVRDLNAGFRASGLTAPDAPARLHAAGFEYVYDGPAAARLPAGTAEIVSAAALDGNRNYEVVYRRDGVTIWKVR